MTTNHSMKTLIAIYGQNYLAVMYPHPVHTSNQEKKIVAPHAFVGKGQILTNFIYSAFIQI